MNSATLANAEQCYLGACMYESRAYWDSGSITSDDFADYRHGIIFDAIQAVMRGEGEAPPILVAKCLPYDNRDELYRYMIELVDATPTGSTAVYYADFIRLHARLRRAMRHLRVGIDVAEGMSFDEATENVQRALDQARIALEAEGLEVDFNEALREAHAGRDTSGRRLVSTTIPSLDNVLGGLWGPQLYVLGARPSVGKSLLAGQIAINAAVHGDRAIGFVSLEMSAGQIMARMLSYVGDDVSGKSPRMWFECRATNIMEIASRIRQWHCRQSIDIAIVDYIQLVRAPEYRQRYEQVGAVSGELKRLAMEMKIPVLALAQLSREHEKIGRRPSLADLRECGNIEQDADVVLLLHPIENRRVELAVAKNRSGRSGLVVELEFNSKRMALVESII